MACFTHVFVYILLQFVSPDWQLTAGALCKYYVNIILLIGRSNVVSVEVRSLYWLLVRQREFCSFPLRN